VRLPHSERFQLPRGLSRPIAVGDRTGRTGVKDFANLHSGRWKDQARPLFGKIAHANEPLRLQDLDDPTQMLIARIIKSTGGAHRQFVGRQIAAG
jgi:hypothetical protein